ncbi:fluoride efflux transporter CrcB [Parafrigoribacterium mesophilum]|uniref:fluoride efflux transporter FluC n=1 Tax=Parafrigoribacterium mesophilum TaxID=433646 RepID=UPI0031FCC3D7
MIATALMAIAGGVGAALRLLLNASVHRRIASTYPVAMSAINISGSFVLGLVIGLAGGRVLPESWTVVIGVGLVGGFTAFSTTSLQTVRLLQTHHTALALLNSFGMLAAAVLVAAVGLWLGAVL